MKLAKLLAIAIAATAISAPAFADSSAMDAAMAPFFMDKEMKQMKSEAEMKEALMSMSMEQKDMLAKECANQNSMHATFCQSFNAINK